MENGKESGNHNKFQKTFSKADDAGAGEMKGL